MTSRSGRPTRAAAFLVAVLAVLPLAACASGAGADTMPTTPVVVPHIAADALEIDVIGDSLSTGVFTPGDPWTHEAQQFYDREQRKVQFVNEAENGAGYVMAGQYGDTFLDEVERVVTPRADVVLLFGSDNDLGQPNLSYAVTTTLNRVHELAPHAEVIVVGPPAPPAQQAEQLAGIRDALAVASERIGDRFVDPMTLNWFQGDTADDVGADDEHPNADGERFLAEQMTAILASAVS